jgi:hypothetical protein
LVIRTLNGEPVLGMRGAYSGACAMISATAATSASWADLSR